MPSFLCIDRLEEKTDKMPSKDSICLQIIVFLCLQEGLKASGITYDVVSNIPKVCRAILCLLDFLSQPSTTSQSLACLICVKQSRLSCSKLCWLNGVFKPSIC